MHGKAVQCIEMAIFQYPRFEADCTFATVASHSTLFPVFQMS